MRNKITNICTRTRTLGVRTIGCEGGLNKKITGHDFVSGRQCQKKTTRVDKKVECVTVHKARLHMRATEKGTGGWRMDILCVTRTSKRILLQFTKTPNNRVEEENQELRQQYQQQ